MHGQQNVKICYFVLYCGVDSSLEGLFGREYFTHCVSTSMYSERNEANNTTAHLIGDVN